MRRRSLVGLLGGAAVAGIRPGYAQAGVPTVGVLLSDAPETFINMLSAALQELGYRAGNNIRFEVRSANGNNALLPDKAAELVRLNVNLIVARLTPAVLAASRATQSIPIVMAGAGDPVGTGLVESLARPGRNVTGVAGVTAELSGKLVEIIRDTLPGAQRVAVLANPTDSFTRPFVREIEQAARALGVEAVVTMVPNEGALEPAFRQMATGQPQAVIVQPSLARSAAAAFALAQRLPAFSPIPSFATEGGLMAYATREADLFGLTASYVDKILRGGAPANLPVSQPTKFDLIINMRTANALGLVIPPTLLARAERLIE